MQGFSSYDSSGIGWKSVAMSTNVEAIQERRDSGDEPTQHNATKHGGEDPGGQIAVEKTEATSCVHDGVRLCVMPLRAYSVEAFCYWWVTGVIA